MYSQETGRLIPPPSRAMSRGNSRRAQRSYGLGSLQHIVPAPDLENMVSIVGPTKDTTLHYTCCSISGPV